MLRLLSAFCNPLSVSDTVPFNLLLTSYLTINIKTTSNISFDMTVFYKKK